MTVSSDHVEPSRSKARNRIRGGILTIGMFVPLTIVLAIIFALPLIDVLAKSFTEPQWGLQNFVDLLESPSARKIFLTTFQVAVVTTALCLVVGYPFAYWVTTLSSGMRRIALVAVLSPLFTAILARLFAWTQILGRRGVINTMLEQLGITDEPLDILFTPLAVTIGMVNVLLPYMVVILYTTMRTIDPALLLAARSLGASGPQVFTRVYAPLTATSTFAGGILVFILALGYFTTPRVLGGGSVVTVPTLIQTRIDSLQWGPATAAALVLLIITVVLFLIFNRLFGVRRLTIGGTRK